jgi:hypothetical protein
MKNENNANPKGVINVYWSAFENSGNIRDFLKYSEAKKGAEPIAENQGSRPESIQTGRPQ